MDLMVAPTFSPIKVQTSDPEVAIVGQRAGEGPGLLLLHGTSDIAANASVDDLPVQLHVAEPDPFETDDWLSAWYLQMGRAGADVEVYRYAGAGHLYTDPDLPDYDEEAAEATWRVALGFLEGL